MEKWQRILKKAEKLLEVIPTQEELQNIRLVIGELVQALTQLQQETEKFPSSHEVQSAKSALRKIDEIMRRYNTRAAPNRAMKRRGKSFDHQVTEEIRVEVQKLTELPEHALANVLRKKEYTNTKLASILRCLGRRPSSKAKKEQLITEIISAITSSRTYEGIGGK